MSLSELHHAGINLGSSDPETHESAGEVVFGFWVFMMSDLVLFALLFAVYGTMMDATAGGPGAKELFELKSAFIETMLLLASSFTYGMASLAMKYGRGHKLRLQLWLLVTLLLGLAFIGMEMRDFMHMAEKGGVASRSGFLSAFYTLVSTHALHVSAGCVWVMVMMVQTQVFGVESRVKTRLMRLGLYWHFLDIVWVCIFSVVYLQGKV